MSEKIVNQKQLPLKDYLLQRLFFTKKEQDALEGKIEMTRELYDSCVEQLMRLNKHKIASDLMREYPEFTEAFEQEAENEIPDTTIPEELQMKSGQMWMDILACIQQYEDNKKE